MQTVSFVQMSEGTKEDYELLEQYESQHTNGLGERIIQAVARLDDSFGGYQVTRLQHSLQGATRASRNNESEEMIIAVLLHDIGDDMAPYSHSEYAAAVLRPFVSEKIYWVVKHHGIFQMYYYAHHLGKNRHARDQFKDHEYYEDTVRFCELYDQNCFDPSYDTLPLSHFEPLIRKFFSRSPDYSD